MATDTMPHTEVARVGFFPRLATYLIDVLTTWVLTGILGGSLWALTGAAGATDETAIAMLPLSAIVIVLAYYTILHAHGRQTVGKRIIGAVVVDTGLGPSATAGPWVGCWPSSSRSLPFNLGYLWALWDRERQTFHDKIASTLVVRTSDLTAAGAR